MENTSLPPAGKSQYRVIDSTLYKRTAEPDSFDIRVHDLGHGHTEATVLPHYSWSEVALLSPLAQSDYAACLANPPMPSPTELIDKLAQNRQRATRRARTKVRRLAKFKGLTVLLTLTYHENMLDRERMARDFDVFIKRVRRVIVDFQYICVFERQKRGAWHAHIAVPRILSHYVQRGIMVKSYDLLRSMWRGVIGEWVDPADGKTKPNGNIDVSRNKRVQRSAAKLAAYLSKYIGKGFNEVEQLHVNSYSASGRALPDAVHERVLTADQNAALRALVAMISPEVDSAVSSGEFHQAFIDGGGYFLCLSPPDR